MKTPKQKHMSYSDRLHIQELLNQNQSFSKIAKIINKDRTTIFREVFNHRFLRPGNINLDECSLLNKTPYVCNGCKKKIWTNLTSQESHLIMLICPYDYLKNK